MSKSFSLSSDHLAIAEGLGDNHQFCRRCPIRNEEESEAEAIRKLAEKPCIILGRCASDILKDRMNVLNIFVCADKEDRIQRIMGKDGLSYEDAKEKVERTDEERASYYYDHTGKTWGDVNDYHMILDTSELGVENCADILMHYFEKLEYI